jgi:competence protein ComEC
MQSTKWLWRIVLILILITIGSSIYLFKNKKSQEYFSISFLDVGQGDSILIQAPNSRQLLIDGGKDKKVLGKLREVLPQSDTSIDVVIGTHPDADHIGGLVDVLNNYNVGAILEPGVSSGSKIYSSFQNLIKEKNIPHLLARAGMNIVLDKENQITFRILFPDQSVVGWETNEASIVGILETPYGKVLLTGDSPTSKELYLINKDGDNLCADILKLGHHGSRTSTSLEYLKIVQPKVAIISAGLDNSYGHPHKEITDRLNFLKIPYLETSKEGTIKCFPKNTALVCD